MAAIVAAGPGQDRVAHPVSGAGVARGDQQHVTWAQRLGSSIPTRLNRNVLEIVLDKDEKGAFHVGDGDCLRVMKKIGLDTNPGVNVEAIQICPNGKGIILITLKDGLPLDPYCRYDVFEVTESGIRAVHVKPAGKREVVITVKGLHPNTRDQTVLDYFAKFGRIVTTKVVHSVYTEGPLKGFKNGDRSYKVELKPEINIGSYHMLDEQKVTVRYSGQHQTCARCHETAFNCVGGAMARRCEAAGGKKVDFSHYILELWRKIDYSPGEIETAALYDDHGEGVIEGGGQVEPQTGGGFTPVKVFSDPAKFTGVLVKQFPKDVDNGSIMEFLVESGLPEELTDQVIVKPNGHVTIKNLENSVCNKLIENIHNKKYSNRKLFCNGIIPLTPVKPAENLSAGSPVPASPTVSPCSPSREGSRSPPASECTVTQTIPSPVPANLAQPEGGKLSQSADTNVDFVRRHSLSLRSPPLGSLADEILASGSTVKRTNSLLKDLKMMQEQLSDFGSCVSFTSSSEEENSSAPLNTQGYVKKKKRKNSRSPPDKSYFVKKVKFW